MFEEIIFGVFDFIKLLIPIVLISFVALKIGVNLRNKIADKYDLSWVKSALVVNLIFIFIILMSTYLFFMFVGFSLAFPQEAELEYTAFEYVLMVGIALIRILVATIILSLALLFFEFLSSITISMQKKGSVFVREIISVIVTSAIFLFLFLFFFSWTAVGLFVYIFYGFVQELPLLSLIISL
ncbi:MAG: hypothetical protein WC915_04420 [archaeon]|jgi:hypothetical protein